MWIKSSIWIRVQRLLLLDKDLNALKWAINRSIGVPFPMSKAGERRRRAQEGFAPKVLQQQRSGKKPLDQQPIHRRSPPSMALTRG
ncbi:unnamed protein product [Victoria cruziana]